MNLVKTVEGVSLLIRKWRKNCQTHGDRQKPKIAQKVACCGNFLLNTLDLKGWEERQ